MIRIRIDVKSKTLTYLVETRRSNQYDKGITTILHGTIKKYGNGKWYFDGSCPSEEAARIIHNKIVELEGTKTILFCPRCEISSSTEGRMIPCPRGSCEATQVN